jgi:hypothetical protein
MPRTERVLSIFLASPGDVSYERSRVGNFVSEWNDLWGPELGIHLELLKWETHAFPAAGSDAQDVINSQIEDEYDIFVGIMWHRIGTPTPRAASGTEEEFGRALKRFRSEGRPHLMFYFKDAPIPMDADSSQVAAVAQFKARISAEGVLYWLFLDPQQFDQLVRVHITRTVQRWARQQALTPALALSDRQGSMARQWTTYSAQVYGRAARLTATTFRIAKAQLAFNHAATRRGRQVRAMDDSQLTMEFMARSLVEISSELDQYADQLEDDLSDLSVDLAAFVDGLLKTASLSIGFRSPELARLRGKSVGIQTTMSHAARELDTFLTLVGNLKPLESDGSWKSRDRLVDCLKRLRNQFDFASLMLGEAKVLFDRE